MIRASYTELTNLLFKKFKLFKFKDLVDLKIIKILVKRAFKGSSNSETINTVQGDYMN